ncbi:hypothetical protein BDR26DRAFT_921228 [Obelidium mucronatum]|nr:hypothetical protein BDR26DRAFT_921228 [Obelidium mucronatum]
MFSFGTPAAAPAGATTTPGTASLFGQAPAQQPQPQPGGGGLFGAVAPAPAATPGGGGGLFGAPAAATPATTAPATTSLFGASQPQNTPANTGLFGAPAAPAASSSLFGAATTAANTTANAQTQQQQPTAIEKSTRYGELPENIRSELNAFETFVQKQIELSEEIAASGFTKRINASRSEFKNIELKYQGLKSLLDRDNALIQNLRGMVGKEMKTADFATRFVDSYQTHRQASMTFNNTDSFQYFVNLTNNLESRLQSYRQTIDDLERHLQYSSQKSQYSPQAIAEIIKQQHDSFLVIASKVSAAHEALGKQRDAFLAYRKKYFGDNKNPFRKGYVGQELYSASDDRVALSTIAAGLKPSDPNASTAGPGAAAGSQPAASGGLFGATQPTTGGLFGATQPAAGGGLFGASQPAAGGFGGFGAAPAGGLFATPSVKKKR